MPTLVSYNLPCASNDLSAKPDPATEFGLNLLNWGSRNATGNVAEIAARQVPIDARWVAISVLKNFLVFVRAKLVPMMYKLSIIL